MLEIVLEKDIRGSFNVSEDDCSRVMRKLGLDPRPGVHCACREHSDLSEWERSDADHLETGSAY